MFGLIRVDCQKCFLLLGHPFPDILTKRNRFFLEIFLGCLYLLAISSWRLLQGLVWDIWEAARKPGELTSSPRVPRKPSSFYLSETIYDCFLYVVGKREDLGGMELINFGHNWKSPTASLNSLSFSIL